MINLRRTTIRVRFSRLKRRSHWDKHYDADDRRCMRKRRSRLISIDRCSGRFFSLWLSWVIGETWSA